MCILLKRNNKIFYTVCSFILQIFFQQNEAPNVNAFYKELSLSNSKLKRTLSTVAPPVAPSAGITFILFGLAV